MKRDEYFSHLQEPFDWELEEFEKEIAVRLAEEHGGEKVLRAWHEFQKDYPLNSFADFEELSGVNTDETFPDFTDLVFPVLGVKGSQRLPLSTDPSFGTSLLEDSGYEHGEADGPGLHWQQPHHSLSPPICQMACSS